MVGQRLVQLLADHPWFEVAALAASEKSAGKPYQDVCNWKISADIPEKLKNIIVQQTKPNLDCRLVFSGLSADIAGEVEESFAKAGYVIVSNSRNHRMLDDVPLLIPEVNPQHLDVIPAQKKRRNSAGFIVTNPNCIAIPLSLALAPLHNNFGVEKIFVTTLQAISGAGYPGVPSMDILDNVIPYIDGEEEKIHAETQKILGISDSKKIVPHNIPISALVNRVAVIDAHLLSVSVKLKHRTEIPQIKEALKNFTALPQKLKLPSAPEHPIILREEDDRPQPRLDRDAEKGMAVVVGRLRPCSIFDVKFSVLGHNTIRGAAGAAILNAELLKEKGLLN